VKLKAATILAQASPDAPDRYLKAIATRTPEKLLEGSLKASNALAEQGKDIASKAIRKAFKPYLADIRNEGLEKGEIGALYREHLLASGLIPNELLAVSKLLLEQNESALNLKELVARAYAASKGLRAEAAPWPRETFTLLERTDEPNRAAYGHLESVYLEALKLWQIRKDTEARERDAQKKWVEHYQAETGQDYLSGMVAWGKSDAYSALLAESISEPLEAHQAALDALLTDLPGTDFNLFASAPSLDEARTDTLEVEFAAFIEAFPKRPGFKLKAVAETASAWALARTQETNAELIEAAEWSQEQTDPQYRKNPDTWLATYAPPEAWVATF